MAEKIETLPAIAPEKSISTADQWELLIQQANVLLDSQFLPEAIDSPQKVVAIVQTGREMGLGMMQSLRGINIIKRKPCLSAELMLALVYRRVPGASVAIIETTPEKCVIVASRPDVEPQEFSFTIEDAGRAGLLSKAGVIWKQYPQIMLQWRCISRVCRAVFPDAVLGMYTPEEMGAEVNIEGEVIALPETAASSKGGAGGTYEPESVAADKPDASPATAPPDRDHGDLQAGQFTRDDEPSDESLEEAMKKEHEAKVKKLYNLNAKLGSLIGDKERAKEMCAAARLKIGGIPEKKTTELTLDGLDELARAIEEHIKKAKADLP